MWFCAQRCDNAGETEWSNVLLAYVDVLVTTIVRCLAERGTRGGERRKLYADAHGNRLELSMKQLIGNVRVLVGLWAGTR